MFNIYQETGGVEELFSLPGRKIKARLIVLDYQANLKNNNESPNELFVTQGGKGNRFLNIGISGTFSIILPQVALEAKATMASIHSTS